MKKQLFLLIVVTIFFVGCCIDGSGTMESKEVHVKSFSKLHVNVPATVVVQNNGLNTVMVETDDNILSHVDVEIDGDTLDVNVSPSDCCIEPTRMKLVIPTSMIKELMLDGSGEIVLEHGFEVDELTLEIDGSGKIVLNEQIVANHIDAIIDGSGDIRGVIDANSVYSQIDGSGKVSLAGKTDIHQVDIDGSGVLNVCNLETNQTDIYIDGSGSCSIWAKEQLNISIDGAGRVQYKGAPVVTKKIDGVGSVQNVD